MNPHTIFTTPRRGLLAAAAIAIAVAISLLLLTAPGASAGSGGIGVGGGTGSGSASGSGGKGNSNGGKNLTPRKYKRMWGRVPGSEKRWARGVSECESGHDPDATALGGDYRGAFMFAPQTWETSPKSPGGDPIDYSYKTQAVVAVALKKRDGTRPWPVCG